MHVNPKNNLRIWLSLLLLECHEESTDESSFYLPPPSATAACSNMAHEESRRNVQNGHLGSSRGGFHS